MNLLNDSLVDETLLLGRFFGRGAHDNRNPRYDSIRHHDHQIPRAQFETRGQADTKDDDRPVEMSSAFGIRGASAVCPPNGSTSLEVALGGGFLAVIGAKTCGQRSSGGNPPVGDLLQGSRPVPIGDCGASLTVASLYAHDDVSIETMPSNAPSSLTTGKRRILASPTVCSADIVCGFADESGESNYIADCKL